MPNMKRITVGIVVIAAAIGALWIARQAKDHGGLHSRPQLAPPEESLPVDRVIVPEKPTAVPTLLPAEEGERPRESVSGTVRLMDTEEPVGGVIVKAWSQVEWTPMRADTGEDAEFEAVTDENGVYQLEGFQPEAMSYVLWAYPPMDSYEAIENGQEVRLREGEARTGVDFTLRSVPVDGSVSGKVMVKSISYDPSALASLTLDTYATQRDFERRYDEAVGMALGHTANRPLPGVKIVLVGRSVRREAISDERGEYTFWGLRPGRYELLAERPEGAVRLAADHPDTVRIVRMQPNEDRTDVDFAFRFDGMTVMGRVTDRGGKPLIGAEVVATPFLPPQDINYLYGEAMRVRSAPVSTVSDEEGRYRLDGLLQASSMEAIMFLSVGRLPGWGETFVIRAQADGYTPTQIVVPALTENLVRDTTGFLEALKTLHARTGIDSDDASASPIEVLLPTSRGNVITGVDLVLEEGAVVMGRLLDTRGDVVPKSRMRMVFADPHDEKPMPLVAQEVAPDWTETDDEGRFWFEGVPAGVFLFEAEIRELGSQRARNAPLEVRAGEFIMDLEVIVEAAEDRGNIEGRIIAAATGAPVEDFSLRVIKVEAPEEDSPRHGKMTIDKPNGTFSIEGVSAGVATLELKAPGYARERMQANVEPGRTTRIRFDLAGEGILRGYVMRNGQPSGAGYVTIRNVEHSQYCGTNGEGYYELGELKAGTYLVNFTMWLYEDGRGGAQACERLWVEVASGHETRVDVDYQGHGVIHGTFEGPEEDKWHVRVFDSSLPEENQLRASTWKFKQNRQYEIIDLPRGTYTVVGICTGEDGAVAEQSQTVSLSEGQSAEVNFDFR
jgi:hypothetical protein